MSEEKFLWDFSTACERLDMSPGALRWKIRMRQIPIVRIGKGRGRIYFNPEKIAEWIRQNEIPPQNGDK